jgi:DNA repair protein RadD
MHRPYQVKEWKDIWAELAVVRSTLLVAECGSGKGWLIGQIAQAMERKGKRCLFGVHGQSLVLDMSRRVSKLGVPHGVLMGSKKREHWHPTQVASIDTLHRMEFPPAADLLIIDEAHMAMSPTWRKTVERYPNAKIIGMTATPVRFDGQSLGAKSGGLFETMVLGPSVQDLIADKYLVPSTVLAPPAPRDLSNLSMGRNDNLKGQAAVSDKAKVIGNIVDHWWKHARDRKTAASAVDKAHAAHITDSFRDKGVQWAYVDDQTKNREDIWKDLDDPHSGLMGVSSVGCHTVGWDHAIVSCLICARKTGSLGWWRQWLGRGSRPYGGKSNFLVLDHVGNTHLHAPYGFFEDIVPWQLEGEAVCATDKDSAPSVSTCKTAGMVNGVMTRPCYATFKSGPDKCPYCGIVLMVKARKIEQVAGELKELDSMEVRANNERIMRAVWESLHTAKKKHGHKPGWMIHIFKHKFGVLPPQPWIREVMSKS